MSLPKLILLKGVNIANKTIEEIVIRYVAIIIEGTSWQNFAKIDANDIDIMPIIKQM